MSTQGILISGNNSHNSANETCKVSEKIVLEKRGRASSAVPPLNLAGSGQENRLVPESLSHRVKSPTSKLKSQIISPRFSITKIDPILVSNKKVNPPTTSTPRELPSLNRRESSNNLRNFFKANGTSHRNSGGSIKTTIGTQNQNNNFKSSTNHHGISLRTSSQTLARTNTATSSSISSSGNKAILRSNSTYCNNSKNGSRISSSNQPPRSPPPASQDQRKASPTPSLDGAELPSPTLTRSTSRDNSTVISDFPLPPDNPEKQFTGGSDKLAYKIWMKERMKYDKWESSKKLFQTKLAEGNTSACHRIVDRLNSELDELTKSIKEDECRRMFPEEPVKPSEFCPGIVKDARNWYQQKVMYEAWENAFNLFQDNMEKGDTTACKKLIDAIQLTIYNPQYKTELPVVLPLTQVNLTRRESTNTPQPTPRQSDQLDQSSKVKFAVADTSISIVGVNGSLPKSRPKLQPPASWTKPRVRETEEKRLESRKTNSDSVMETSPEEVKREERSVEEVEEKRGEIEIEVYDHFQNPSYSGSTSSDLIEAIDSVLAELNSNNFFNPTHISS